MKSVFLRYLLPVLLLALVIFAIRRGADSNHPSSSTPSVDASRPDAGRPPGFFELFVVSPQPGPGLREIRTNDGVIFVESTPLISDADVARARAVANPNGPAMVELTWTPQGRRRFAEATRSHLGQTLALLIDQHLETLLAFDAPIDEASVQIGKGGATTMEAAAAFAARFGRGRR